MENKYCEEKLNIKSFASNANALINVEGKGLLLKHSNDAWDMLLPIYATTIKNYEFISNNKNDLLDEYEKAAKFNNLTVDTKKEKLETKLKEEFGLDVIDLDEVVYQEKCIKYSKTAKENRLYIMDFYVLRKRKTLRIEKIAKEDIFFLPLDKEAINEVVKSHKYKGYDVVSNVNDILKNEKILEGLREKNIKC